VRELFGNEKWKGKRKEDDMEKKEGRELKKEDMDEDDEKRDTVLALFPHPLYDSKKKVKFSTRPSSTESSRAPSLAEDRSSRPLSLAEDQSEKTLPDDGLLYPIPEPRFDYPIGDMIMNDMSRFERHFKIRPPNSVNWICYSGKGIDTKTLLGSRTHQIPRLMLIISEIYTPATWSKPT
jgi:hypothetical protein